MAISNVAVGDEVTASKTNAIIGALNAMNNRQIFTSSGSFTWPTGVNRIRVYICGGGGRSGDNWSSGGVAQPCTRGGNSPLCSKGISGVDEGTTIPVTIGGVAYGTGGGGAGTGPGGTSSFGTYVQSSGGTGGHSATHGTDGTHTGEIQHDNRMFVASNDGVQGPIGYGQGFPSNSGTGSIGGATTAGGPGICVIEW